MDTLELVRRRARSRRAAALGDGDDPPPVGWQVVSAAARQQGYDLFELEPDDALLGGAEAMLDRGVEAIFFNGAVSEDLAATLVAHELGHLDLHAGTTLCGAAEVDASAPDEPASAGVRRVEGYGARERQELQANVYARELLLPREISRTLFLDRRFKARDIAATCQLPLELVRQQLCESLLTPEPPEPLVPAGDATPSPTLGGHLDPSQRAAAEHTGSPLLLEAGPGTGKTRTLVARIVRLVEQGVEPASILALTFSNKAAREITERVASSLPEEAPAIWTGTFHAFGLEILRKHHELVGLDAKIRIFDRSDAIDKLENALPVLGLKHHQNLYEPALELKEMLAAVSRAKDELVDFATYAALARTMQAKARDAAEREAAERALEVAKVYEMYQRILDLDRAVDFGDLILKPTRLLESQPAVRAAVRLRHRHVLVDEYQDVNRASARLLKAIAGDGRRLWVVGDARQSIYRFRGASSSNMRLFAEDFPGASQRALGINYRSSQEIVETLTRFAPHMRASSQSLPLELESHRGPAGSAPDVFVAPDRDGEISAVAARILELERAGVPFSEQAVLFRSNGNLNRFSAGLEARGVPVLHLGSLFERGEVRDMLSLLWLLGDPRGGALMRVAAFPAYAVPATDLRLYLRMVREKKWHATEALARLDQIPELSPEATEGLSRLGNDLVELDRKATPWQILARYLFDDGPYLRDLLSREAAERPLASVALYQLLGFLRTARPGGRGFPATRLLNKVRRLVFLTEEVHLRQIPQMARHLAGVKLMTIHGAKGLEFEAVHLPAMTVSGLPANFRPPRCPPPDGMISGPQHDKDPVRESHHAEEECLFFVAASRSRTHLCLYRSRTAGKVTRKPSKFLSGMGFAAAFPREAQEATQPVGEPVLSIAREGLGPLDGRDIAQYERCPRRFFYGRLFGLAGSYRDSAYLKAHRTIYAVIDWLKEQPAGAFPSPEQALEHLDQVWKDVGPTGHAFERQFRSLAETLVGRLITSHEGRKLETAKPLAVPLPSGEVAVAPDLWIGLEDGRVLLRILRTGRKGSFQGDDTIHGLFEAAARLRYGLDGYELDVLHLTDHRRTPIAMSLQKVISRVEKSEGYLSAMVAGKYPPQRDQVRCPLCPYFFVCPTVPGGPLKLGPGEPEVAPED